MRKNVNVRKNMFMNAVLTMSSFIFQLISFPYVSRVLSPTGLGKSSFAISFVSYFVLLSQLGIPTYGVVTCAKVRKNREKLSRVVCELLLINIVTTIISYFAFLSIVLYVPKLSMDKTLYIIASAPIILNTFGMEWLYRALEQYSYISKRSILFKLIALALLILVRSENDYILYTGIVVFATSASQILNLIYSRNFINFNFKNLSIKRHISSICVFFAMSCATTIYTHMDSVMLGFMQTDAIVGYYSTAIKIKSFLTSIVTSLGAVLLPRASFYIRNNNYEKFIRISFMAISIVFILGASFSVFFSAFAKQAILFLSGPEYINSVIPMVIIMPTVLFIGLTNVSGIQMLVPMGKEKIVLLSEVMGAIINVILNSMLIPKYGASGAAIGTLTAEFTVFIIQFIAIKSLIYNFFKDFPFTSFIVTILVSCIVALELSKFGNTSFLKLLLGATIYFSLLLLWGIKTGILNKVLTLSNMAEEI